MTPRRCALALLCLPLLVGCSSTEPRRPKQIAGPLPAGIVASVGTERISAGQLAALMHARGVSRQHALDLLLFDALTASEAKSRGLSLSPRVLVARRAWFAQQLVEQIRAEQLKGPVSDREVEEMSEKHWLTMLRPEARRTAHVVVSAKDRDNRDQVAAAKRLAHTMAEQLQGIDDPKVFMDKANKIAKDNASSDLKVIAQQLAPVVKDGRVADIDNPPPPGAPVVTYASSFVRAAFRLRKPGDQSGVVQSPFGFHVILLTQIVPPQMRSKAERRRVLSEEIRAARANRAYRKLIDSLRAKAEVNISPSNDRLFESLKLHFSTEAN